MDRLNALLHSSREEIRKLGLLAMTLYAQVHLDKWLEVSGIPPVDGSVSDYYYKDHAFTDFRNSSSVNKPIHK